MDRGSVFGLAHDEARWKAGLVGQELGGLGGTPLAISGSLTTDR